MATWEGQTSQPSLSTPQVKFEASPAESFLSTPSELYPSLFDNTTTVESVDGVMTPESCGSEENSMSSPTPAPSTPAAQGAEGEKKPAKKRKSWGQVLPEPKTNLPPR
jgi:transcriptional activator HAC1